MSNSPLLNQQIKQFNRWAHFDYPLPEGVRIMNPYEQSQTLQLSDHFYDKYYSDNKPRKLILGINPGRHGAGITGIPFTDSKRLIEYCDIDPTPLKTHEPSSVFIYQMIHAYGGVAQFYQDYYFTSPCPLGLIQKNPQGNWINANYYDNKQLQQSTLPFIVDSMNYLKTMNVLTERVFVLGKGKNIQMLNKLNKEYGWFQQLEALEHPRFIIQYRSKQITEYIDKFLQTLK